MLIGTKQISPAEADDRIDFCSVQKVGLVLQGCQLEEGREGGGEERGGGRGRREGRGEREERGGGRGRKGEGGGECGEEM